MSIPCLSEAYIFSSARYCPPPSVSSGSSHSASISLSLSASELSKIVIPEVDRETQEDMIDSYREAVMNGSESDPDVVIFGKEIGDDGE